MISDFSPLLFMTAFIVCCLLPSAFSVQLELAQLFVEIALAFCPLPLLLQYRHRESVASFCVPFPLFSSFLSCHFRQKQFSHWRCEIERRYHMEREQGEIYGKWEGEYLCSSLLQSAGCFVAPPRDNVVCRLAYTIPPMQPHLQYGILTLGLAHKDSIQFAVVFPFSIS